MHVKDVELTEALGERYLSYALSTIVSRSLPDVRDGLKPVHRRLLYAMRELKLNPKSGYKKCARVVGDVIGKYHPHGELAIYDAMVRMAQDFAVRYPLVDGQGNFGNIDGDTAAAMRYTEARLTMFAEYLMEDLDDDTVDFKATYDGEHDEPIVMPAALPNLLANGATGIAVGMASSIPPHNLEELIDATIHIIKKPSCSVADLMNFVQGPDFPTGGVIVENRDLILKAYETGRGSIRMRAKWEVEQLSHGQYQVIVTEIPYMVQKSKLIEKIADLLLAKKLPLLGDIRDESTDVVRIVFEPKSRMVDPTVLMESLFRHTDLDSRFNLNMNVVDARGTPRVMNLKEVLEAFITHRLEVIERKSKNRLKQIEHRLVILDGLLIAYLNLDEVIRIIREEDEPAQVMMQRWNLNEVQTEAILNMRLRSLRKLEEIEIKSEYDKLSKEKASLEALLASDDKKNTHIMDALKSLKKQLSKDKYSPRKSTFGDTPTDVLVPIEAMVEKEPITIVCSDKGWIRSMKGHSINNDDLKYKEGDSEKFVLKAETTDKLLVFTSLGKFYTIGMDKLPGGRGQGEPLRLMIDMDHKEEVLDLIIFSPQKSESQKYIVAANDGRGFIVSAGSLIAQTKNGKQIMNFDKNTNATLCHPVNGDMVAVVGENRRMLIFKLDEIPEMARGRGVRLQKYRDARISDLKTFNGENGLSWQNGGRNYSISDIRMWLGKRGQIGRLVPTGFPRSNKFI